MPTKHGNDPKQNFFIKFKKLQHKALRIINFLPNTAPISETYKNSKILKLSDYISLQNALLVKNSFEKQLLKLALNFSKKTTNSTITQRILPRKTLHLWRKLTASNME